MRQGECLAPQPPIQKMVDGGVIPLLVPEQSARKSHDDKNLLCLRDNRALHRARTFPINIFSDISDDS